MAHWERREADTLAEAIGKHRKNNPRLTEQNALLALIQAAVDDSASTVNTTAGTLSLHRAQVCAICRGSNLYTCDVAEGWSNNCAMIFANTTEFSPL
jgi:hypothetical protein